MLIAHKVLDAIINRGHGTELELHRADGASDEYLNTVASWLIHAEKFDFGVLPLEQVPAEQSQAMVADPKILKALAQWGAGNAYAVPQLTDEEIGFWLDGLIPFPAPYCWFEFVMGGRSGLLVADFNDALHMIRMDVVGRQVGVDGLVAVQKRQLDLATGHMAGVELRGNQETLDIMKKMGNNFLIHNFGSNVYLAVYMALMLNSKTTEVSTEHAPPKLNKAREKRNQIPLFDHRVVRIVPTSYLRGQGGDGTHASPRLHWRRSHVRTLHRGEPNEKRVVIPRHLVGKAELGEISHEYKVIPNRNI